MQSKWNDMSRMEGDVAETLAYVENCPQVDANKDHKAGMNSDGSAEQLRGNRLRFKTMLFLTGTFFIVELTVGIAAHSLALTADALHMLSDLLALCVGYYAVSASSKPRTPAQTYGLKRMEIVGALVNGIFMLSICFFIALEAIQTIIFESEISEELKNGSHWVLYAGVVGLIVNILGIMVFSSSGISHGHQHGHDDAHTKERNLNIQGVLLHVIGDALGSVIVIVSALILTYSSLNESYIRLVDPICSLLLAGIVTFSSIPLVRRASGILLQNVPRNISGEKMFEILMSVPNVLAIHEFHLWELSSNVVILSMHVVIMSKEREIETINELKLKIHEFGVHSSTIQPEIACPSAIPSLIRKKSKEPDNQSKQVKENDGWDSEIEVNPEIENLSLREALLQRHCHDPQCSEQCDSKRCCQ